jgi:glycosyltransferase involved in cell wall biosynthesis
MVTLYSSHRYLLVPSRAGGTELPVIEGAACGCVPIVTNYGGMAHYVPDNYIYHIPVKTMLPMYDDRWYKPTIHQAASESDKDFHDKSGILRRTVQTHWNYSTITTNLLGFMNEIYNKSKLSHTEKTDSPAKG